VQSDVSLHHLMVNMLVTFSSEEYMDMLCYGFCTGSATATVEKCWQWFPHWRILFITSCKKV